MVGKKPTMTSSPSDSALSMTTRLDMEEISAPDRDVSLRESVEFLTIVDGTVIGIFQTISIIVILYFVVVPFVFVLETIMFILILKGGKGGSAIIFTTPFVLHVCRPCVCQYFTLNF